MLSHMSHSSIIAPSFQWPKVTIGSLKLFSVDGMNWSGPIGMWLTPITLAGRVRIDDIDQASVG